MKQLLLLTVLTFLLLVGCANVTEIDLCKESEIPFDCIAGLALKASDVSICEEIEESMAHDMCVQRVSQSTNNVSLCFDLTEQYWSDICFKNHALKNYTLCLYVHRDRNNCYYDSARENKDYHICEFITDSDLNLRCFFKIALETNSTEPCQNLDFLNKNFCINSVARNTKNESMCLLVKIPDVSQRCLELVKIQP